MRKLILFSLALNLGLIVALAYFAKKQTAVSVSESSSAHEAKSPSKRGAKTETVVVKTAGEKFDWRNVESEDYKKYIANLRAIFCPEETVRDIIIADVNKYYASRLKPLRKPVEEWKFWRNDGWGGPRESEEFYKAQREIEKEKRALLKELLGDDYEKEVAKQYGWNSDDDDPFLANLPQETKDKIGEIQRNFYEQQSEIHRKAKGYIDDETQADLRKLQKQQYDDLAKILSPEDLLEWGMRNSPLAQNLKNNELEAFDASEEEFRAIYQAKLNANLAKVDFNDETTGAQQRDADKVEKDALKSALGEDRYKEYQMAQSWDYRQLVRTAEQQGLPKENAQAVYQMKDDVQKAVREVNSDKSLTPEARREKLVAIKAATEQQVTATLGERGFKAWKREAWWMRSIVPPEPQK